MKQLLFLLFLIAPFITYAQSSKQKPPKDSVQYYQRELGKLWKSTVDSLKSSDEYNTIIENLDRLRKKYAGYTGPILFTDILHSNYTKFNNSIVQNGFPPLKSTMTRIGFGISNKRNKTIYDIYFATVGINNTTKKGDEKIKTSLSNVFQLDLGYDVLNSKVVNLYPFAGFSLRFSNLSYSKPTQTNSSYTNITNIVTNDQKVNSSSFKLGYQLGLGLDIAIATSKSKKTSTLFFTKFGVNNAVGIDKYKIEDVTYKPGIKQGDWLVTLGFKFVSWR